MSTEISALNNRPVIIGGGVAGLMTALQMAPEPVLLLSKAPLGAEASSLWAQGGLAAAMGDDDDPALHLADTLAAGAGLCDEAVASRIVHAAPAAVEHLARLGVAFDRGPDGGWRLGLEAAHGRNRIVHADRRRHRPRDHARADRSGAPLPVDHTAGGRRGAQPDRRGQCDQRACSR